MFRFKIRDVLWLTVVGLSIAWWAEHRRQTQANLKFTAAERMLQFMLDRYYADTGQHIVVGEDTLDLHYRPTNVKPATSP